MELTRSQALGSEQLELRTPPSTASPCLAGFQALAATPRELIDEAQTMRKELAQWHATAGGQANSYLAQLEQLQSELEQQMQQLQCIADSTRQRVRATLAANGDLLEQQAAGVDVAHRQLSDTC